MRRKKYLDERLNNCSDNLIIIDRKDLNFKSNIEETELFNYSKLFGNNNPVHLEIGCGKGQFACEIAKQNPDINFIAVEKTSNVIVMACEKAREQGIKNLIFVKCSAEYLRCYLPKNSIEKLYLNFSCPYPKKTYANHRLTAKPFLEIYKEILKPHAEIHFKTDNRGLFEFSIEELSNNGFALKNVSLDLHNSDIKDNIVTEYEQKFVNLGYPIFRLVASQI